MCKNTYPNSRRERCFDLTIASGIAPVCAAALGATALAIGESPTTTHTRTSPNGNTFTIKKLTTLANPVGDLMVAAGFDELPQIQNIFSGSMSVVGPRATLPEHFAKNIATLPPAMLEAWTNYVGPMLPGLLSSYGLLSHHNLGAKEAARLRAYLDVMDALNASVVYEAKLCMRALTVNKAILQRWRDELWEQSADDALPDCQRCDTKTT